MKTNPLPMLSLAAVARRLDLPYNRAQALAKAGVLLPSALGPHNQKLFNAERLEAMRAAVAAAQSVGGRIIS